MTKLIKTLSLLFLLNIVCAYGMEHDTRDSRLLLELPDEILGSIVPCAGKSGFINDLFYTVKLLIQVSWVCKKLEHLSGLNKIKTIVSLNQEKLDDSLFKYSDTDSVPFLKLLIAMGANVNARPNGKTLLTTTIQNNNTAFVEELLRQKNINVNELDELGFTPLHHATFLLLNTQCDESLLLLLQDYRVNTLLTNINHTLAHAYLDESDTCSQSKQPLKKFFIHLMRNILYARSVLDGAVAEQARMLQSNNVNSINIDNAINTIKDRIETYGKYIWEGICSPRKMKSFPYPIDECIKSLPYATDEFIKNMLLYRIQYKHKGNNRERMINIRTKENSQEFTITIHT